MPKRLQLTKLEAVRRQLDTAISLYFTHGDPVSIHTLALAAYNAIRDLNDKAGLEPMLVKGRQIDDQPGVRRGAFFDRVKPEYHRRVYKLFRQSENFFKHADRDSGKTLTFRPETTEFFIYDAIVKYQELTSELHASFAVFKLWFWAHYPELFDFSDTELQRLDALADESRKDFWETHLPIISQCSSRGDVDEML